MELQKGHEDLCRKRAKRAFFLWFFRDCHPRSLSRPDIAYTIMVWNDSYFIAIGNFNFKRLTMMTARKPVEIKRRCQEQRHHCLHSLPFVLQTETHTHANSAVGWDGMSRLRYSATSNRGVGTGVTAARPSTNLVWQCHTVPINNF